MLKEKIGIIGLGNMGSALAKGLKKAELISPQNLLVFDIKESRLNSQGQKLGLSKTISNPELVEKSQGVIIAVKPQDMAQVLEETRESWKPHQFIISIAAGITLSFIEKKLKKEISIIRAMPNSPAQIGAGITALSYSRWVSDQHKNIAKNIFQVFGEVIEVDEAVLDLVTALSGSGPAYFFLIMEAMIEAGQTLGLDKATVEKLVKETALGAAKLAKISPESLSELRQKVTSPGGTTEAALKVFEEANLKKIIFQAVQAAKNRAKELSQTY